MVIKCKMCGGDLNILDENPVSECEFCGTKQTVPVIDDEKKVNLFNRANKLRMNADYDKAAAVYASITAEFPEEAEAYWGLCLCKYGIDYVDDPATEKKIPTCHRTLPESIMNDSDFDQACENADPVAMRLYREEAKEIDRIQRAILDIVSNEPPYDVFICYKENDENGERTEDSVLAQDIFESLDAKDLRVFFARISLEDKLGKEYEPYIYAALHSSKVMLAIGTKYEYYTSAWVKNEWARFLDMMKNDCSKTLIPCYKDLDAYDMPKEFKNLQAQDMGKIGWLQDLSRGVMKLIRPEMDNKDGSILMSNATEEERIKKRAYLSLQDEDYYEAVKFFDRALDLDPMDAEAYLGKFLAHNKIKTLQDLKRKAINLDDNKWFRRAMEFSDDELRACLTQVKEICLANNNTQTEKDSINEFIESIFRKNFSFAPRGYKKMEVDCFLDDICEALEYINNSTGKPKLMVNDIIVKVFSYEEKGYNQIEVDSFLDEIADYYEDLLKQKGLYNEEDSEIEDEEIKVSQINAAIQQKKNEITFLKSERRKLRLLDRKKKEEIDSRVAEIELKIEDLKKKQNKIRMMGGRTDDPAD